MKLVPYAVLVGIFIFSVGPICRPRMLLNSEVFQGLTTIQEVLYYSRRVGRRFKTDYFCKKFRKVLKKLQKERTLSGG